MRVIWDMARSGIWESQRSLCLALLVLQETWIISFLFTCKPSKLLKIQTWQLLSKHWINTIWIHWQLRCTAFLEMWLFFNLGSSCPRWEGKSSKVCVLTLKMNTKPACGQAWVIRNAGDTSQQTKHEPDLVKELSLLLVYIYVCKHLISF